MIESLDERFAFMEDGIQGVRTFDKVGTVRRVTGLIIESEGPEVSIGQVCSIVSDRHNERIEAQVVGFRENYVLLMALDMCIQFIQVVRYLRSVTITMFHLAIPSWSNN